MTRGGKRRVWDRRRRRGEQGRRVATGQGRGRGRGQRRLSGAAAWFISPRNHSDGLQTSASSERGAAVLISAGEVQRPTPPRCALLPSA